MIWSSLKENICSIWKILSIKPQVCVLSRFRNMGLPRKLKLICRIRQLSSWKVELLTNLAYVIVNGYDIAKETLLSLMGKPNVTFSHNKKPINKTSEMRWNFSEANFTMFHSLLEKESWLDVYNPSVDAKYQVYNMIFTSYFTSSIWLTIY